MELSGNHIYLKPLDIQDAQALLELEVNNQEFYQTFSPEREEDFLTLEYQTDLIRRSMEQREADKRYSYGIFLKTSGQMIGNIGLSFVVRGPLQSCMAGYSLDRGHNGKGYTTEAVRLIVDYAFRELQFHRITAEASPQNIGSVRVLEKAGFHQEGLARKNVKINGKWEDHLVFAIINEED